MSPRLEERLERLARGPVRFALRPLGWAYLLGRFADRGSRIVGIRPVRRLPRFVACVGNLTTGGTGKTPMLIAIAGELRARGLRVTILSRGHGAVPPAREARVVSDGERIVASVEASGDEPMLLARALPGTPVVVGASRHAAGLLAMREFAPDVLLLDDGFQHDALARDLDIVLWDARDLPEEQRPLPEGRMREPLSAIRRAGAIVITHAEYLDLPGPAREQRLARIVAGLKRHAPGAPVFEATTRLSGIRPMGAASIRPTESVESWRGRRVVLADGLARPDGFEALVRAAGLEVAQHLKFGDHARYGPEDLERILGAVASRGAVAALVTEKDAVKLEPLLGSSALGEKAGGRLFSVGAAMEVREAPRWGALLDEMERAARGRISDPPDRALPGGPKSA